MQTLLLLGSGEFTKSMTNIDKRLIADHEVKNVAVIPTAAGKENNVDRWLIKAEEHFLDMGVTVFGIKAFNGEDTNNQELVAPVKDSQMIIFSGGDPEYLNISLKGSALLKIVMEKYKGGSVLIGSSAGAMVMGKKVLSNPQGIILGKTNWTDGLGLIDYQIIPHFNMFTRFGGLHIMKQILSKLPADIENKFLGIDEDTALIITDNKHVKVMGTGKVTVFINLLQKTYKANDEFDL